MSGVSPSRREPTETRVFVVGSGIRFGVVSDVDDTVMVTALPRPFQAAWNSFVLDELAAEVSSVAAFVFGDSASDRLMAVTAVERGFDAVEFCWVGSTAPPSIARVQTRKSELPHAEGTEALLRSIIGDT